MNMDEYMRRRDSDTEDGMTSDNVAPIQSTLTSKAMKRHKSRSRSRKGSASPQKMGRYTPPLTNGRTSPMKHHSKDFHVDEPISILDPRRFTPTLHANLVAEILSLRRDLEAKSGLIESLENDLSAARAETETTAESVAYARKEARDVQKQLRQRDNDEALEELVYERDQALETIGDLKRQVERLTKSRRKAEEDLERNQQIANREKTEWEAGKRTLEHRVHVAEGRLKTLLQEIASANESNGANIEDAVDNLGMRPESMVRPVSRNSIRSIASSVSEGSGLDTEKGHIRFSMINAEASHSALRLADELEFIDEVSESEAETEASVYPESLAELQASTDDFIIPEEPTPNYLEHAATQTESISLAPSRPASIFEDDKSEITERTITGVEEEELHDLRSENQRLQELVRQLEESVKLEKQEREAFENSVSQDLATWQNKYHKQNDDYEARELQEQHEREILKREHQDQLELLESIAADTQHQLEILASEKAELKRSMEASLRAKQAALEIDEEDVLTNVETVINEIINEALEETSIVRSIESVEEQDIPAKSTKTFETPRSSVIFLEDDLPQSPREISANERRKRISLIAPVSPPLSPPSTATRRSSAAAYTSSEAQTTDVVIAEPGVDVGCQTDKPPTPPPTPTFIIPSITIHPPPPTIISYEPKPMKNAGTQTSVPPQTRSTSMQTEAIKVDVRILKNNFSPPPQREAPRPPISPPQSTLSSRMGVAAPLVSPTSPTYPPPPVPVSVRPNATAPLASPITSMAIVASPIASPTTIEVSPPPVPPEKSARRGFRGPLNRLHTAPVPMTVAEVSESPQSSPPQPRRSMSEDSIAPLPIVSPNGVFRPPRTTSLWRYNDIPSDDDDDDVVEPESLEDEFKTALSAPKPPKPIFNQPIGGVAGVRDSMLPKRHPSIKRNIATTKPVLPARSWNQTIPNSSNSRRISGVPIGPPYPVPLRHSSRKLPPSITSSRASSPSPMPGGIRRTRNSLRKSRSALALTADGSVRTRSPPPMSLSSAAPESPTDIPPLPRDTILPNSLNRPGFGGNRHRHQDSSLTGTASVDSAQQTSVVDAIAQTMVGEFLYKYVRKRFGQVQESPQNWEKDDGGGASGVRHKRWVWLAPYERAVMWSTRQPTSGHALLGKSGRKLSIQSVLDVKDDTPPPRGVTLFNRSILILTPARALKFTAGTQERHYIWLMALSFLAHSSQSPGNALTLPPALPFEVEQLTQRAETREGKGKEKATAPSYMSGGESDYYDHRPTFQNPFSAHGSFTTNHSYTYSNPDDGSGYGGSYGANRRTSRYGSVVSDDSAADFPTIARHSRKRSNTAYPAIIPRMPPARNFTSPTFSGSGYSGGHRISNSIGSDWNCNVPFNADRNSIMSYGNGPPTAGSNFFDAIPNNTGTMRMEAFIDPAPRAGRHDEDDDVFPDLARGFSGRSSNRNSRIGAYREKGFMDFYGVPDDPYHLAGAGKSRYSEEDDSIYHRRDNRDLFAGF